jgi:hypothetical protein
MAVAEDRGVWATTAPLTVHALDEILALQFLVAWAGEGRSKPKRLGWWDTDLVDTDGGGDLLARLVSRTHAWAALEAVRKAARQTDTTARERHGEPDRLRTIFFLGFEVDEKLSDRLSVHKRASIAPIEALPLPFALGGQWSREKALAAFAAGGAAAFSPVPPVGRQVKDEPPSGANDLVRQLVAALVPPTDAYPMPLFRVGSSSR